MVQKKKFVSKEKTTLHFGIHKRVCSVLLLHVHLLPQPNGQYSNSGTHYTGDKVVVTCSSGYYIEDDPSTLEEMEMECYGTHWYPEQKHCMLLQMIGCI